MEQFLDFAKTAPIDDLRRLPLPFSIREKLGIFQDVSYMPIQKAMTKALFNDNRYDSMVEIQPDPDIVFPDLTKLAEEYKKQFLVEEEEKTQEEPETESITIT